MVLLNVGLMVIFYCLAQLFRRIFYTEERLPASSENENSTCRQREPSFSSSTSSTVTIDSHDSIRWLDVNDLGRNQAYDDLPPSYNDLMFDGGSEENNTQTNDTRYKAVNNDHDDEFARQESSISNGNHESSSIIPPNRQCQDISCMVSPNLISDNGRLSQNEIQVSIISQQVNVDFRNIYKKHARNNDKDCLPSYTDIINQDSNN